MSSKLGSASAHRYSEKDRGHGIGQLPSDDINELMHNNYNKMYLHTKSQRDSYLNQVRQQHQAKLKEVRDTHANKLKADHQQQMARELHDQTNNLYHDRAPLRITEKSEREDASETLPPLKTASRTKSVTSLSGKSAPMNKYVKKNQLPVDIQATVPRASLIENFVVNPVLRPAFNSLANARQSANIKSDALAARSLRNDMVKDYI